MKLRKILALVLAVLMVCTVFAACGNDDASSTASGESSTAETSSTAEESETSEDASSEATTSETGTDGEGVTLNIRAGMEPTSMNTLNSTYSLEFSLINHMYDKLYMLDENDVPQLSAAETVDISDDQLVYTFHLREDGMWSNGDPVTANDFAFAWQQALNPAVAADYAYFLYFIKNAEAYYNYQGYAADPEAWEEANAELEEPQDPPAEVNWEDVGVKVLDDMTLEVTLENPIPYAPFMFAFGTLAPINQAFYEECGQDLYNSDAEYFCTNGRYVMTEWVHDSEMVLEKNPNWRDPDSLPVDTLNFRIISDGQTALTSFLAGELDMTELGTQQIMQQAEDAGYEIHSYSDGSSFYAMVNTSDPQLSNVNLRRALALGFDKQAFIDTAIGLPYSPMKAFTAPAVNGADGTSFSEALLKHEGVDAMAPVNGDIEAAKGYLETALSELGITADQLTLSIDCGDSQDAQTQAAFLQNQWLENLGIEVTINPKQPKQGSADRKNGNYQMSITGWSPDYNDPMTFLDMWVSDGGNNDTRWGTDEYDQLIADATVETDVNARQEMFYQCEETVFDQYFIIPIYNRTQSYVVSDKIANIQRSTFTDFNLMTVELA